MAGDWIKMRVDLADDPAVISISNDLGVDEDQVVGKLHRLWAWADRHTTEGEAVGITERWVDKYAGHAGFAAAMVKVHWLSFNDVGVVFPNFSRHNGESAKKRAEAAIRQRLSRELRDKGVTGVARGTIPRPFKDHVFERDGFTCVYCGDVSSAIIEDGRKATLSIDHLIPETRGGKTVVENLVTSCRKCNNEKNDRTPEEWGILPTFLRSQVTYVSQKICDSRVTSALPEKRREEKSNTPLPPKGGKARGFNQRPRKEHPTARVLRLARETAPKESDDGRTRVPKRDNGHEPVVSDAG